MIIQPSPTRIDLPTTLQGKIQPHLEYIDQSVDFELNKHRQAKKYLARRYSGEALNEALAEWKEREEELKKERKRSLLFGDERGPWTYSGLGWWLAEKFGVPLQNEVVYPDPHHLPWERKPSKEPRPYQFTMKEALLAERHGAVEVGTGLGKSFVIMLLAKELGLKTVVMTPSQSIAAQIHAEFIQHFGQKRVGQYFDGKKEPKKQFVIAVDDSLTKVEEGSEHWALLSKAQVFIADESHLCPANSLRKVCFGLLANAPYRFFFSGTQMRNDGLDLLLQGITGKIVFRMTVREGVDQGYLARPMFRMVKVASPTAYTSHDPNDMTRAHLYYNPVVNAKAGEIANLMVEALDRPTVILVKELEQFTCLLPYFRHPVKFAHGGVTKKNRHKIPEQFWDSDTTALVDEFNRGELPILVGTSCITTGTDLQIVKSLIYLQGGKSEIQVKQAVGRGTRRPPGKDDCFVIDFDVYNIETTHRHAEERKLIYADIYPDFEALAL